MVFHIRSSQKNKTVTYMAFTNYPDSITEVLSSLVIIFHIKEKQINCEESCLCQH